MGSAKYDPRSYPSSGRRDRVEDEVRRLQEQVRDLSLRLGVADAVLEAADRLVELVRKKSCCEGEDATTTAEAKEAIARYDAIKRR